MGWFAELGLGCWIKAPLIMNNWNVERWGQASFFFPSPGGPAQTFWDPGGDTSRVLQGLYQNDPKKISGYGQMRLFGTRGWRPAARTGS